MVYVCHRAQPNGGRILAVVAHVGVSRLHLSRLKWRVFLGVVVGRHGSGLACGGSVAGFGRDDMKHLSREGFSREHD